MLTCRTAARYLAASGFVALLAAGCSAPQGPAATPSTQPAGGPAQPKVNRVVMSIDPVGTETNELRKLSSPDVWIFRSVYEYPLAIDIKTEKLVPGLATAWSIENNGLDYRVKLRPGVKFHGDFGDLSAKDLVHMWKDITGPDGVHGQTNYWRMGVKDVEVVNDLEVVYHLTKPDAQFALALSESQGGAEIRSKAKFDKDGNAPTNLKTFEAGTGWYQPIGREQSQYLRMQRIAYPHWDAYVPEFPEFEFRFVKEPSTRLAALLSGEIQVTTLPEDLLQQAVRGGMKTIKSKIPGLRVMGSFQCCSFVDAKDPSKGYRWPDSPLMDVRVRQALNKAINRDEMNKAFFGGKGLPMYLNSFLPTREGWSTDWEKRYSEMYGFDPAKAKALLAEAGYTAEKPLKTTMIITPVPGVAGGPDIEEAIGGYWRSIGVNVDLLSQDGGEVSAKNRAFTYTNHVWVRGTGSNQWTGTSVYNGAAYGTGAAGVNDPDFEKALAALTVTIDDKKRDELWRQAGDVYYNKFMTLSLFWFQAEAIVNPNIVADWPFPGSLTGTWTHVHLLKAK